MGLPSYIPSEFLLLILSVLIHKSSTLLLFNFQRFLKPLYLFDKLLKDYKASSLILGLHFSKRSSASCGKPSKMGVGKEDDRPTSAQAKKDAEEDATEPESLNLLPIAISCVMLMAAEVSSISEEYFTWTEKYLSCIKDEFGNHPPNVQGVLNHISYLQENDQRNQGGSGRKRDDTSEDDDESGRKQSKSNTPGGASKNRTPQKPKSKA